jgi:hypothetical protein
MYVGDATKPRTEYYFTVGCHTHDINTAETFQKLLGLNPRANYTGQTTAACRRS